MKSYQIIKPWFVFEKSVKTLLNISDFMSQKSAGNVINMSKEAEINKHYTLLLNGTKREWILHLL